MFAIAKNNSTASLGKRNGTLSESSTDSWSDYQSGNFSGNSWNLSSVNNFSGESDTWNEQSNDTSTDSGLETFLSALPVSG